MKIPKTTYKSILFQKPVNHDHDLLASLKKKAMFYKFVKAQFLDGLDPVRAASNISTIKALDKLSATWTNTVKKLIILHK